jgi:hypothetical protein
LQVPWLHTISSVSCEQINFKMNSPARYHRLVSAAFALVEPDKADDREFVERAQHILRGAAGEWRAR